MSVLERVIDLSTQCFIGGISLIIAFASIIIVVYVFCAIIVGIQKLFTRGE